MLHSRRVVFQPFQFLQSIARFSTSSRTKTALVTGGNRGIGLQACKQLCDEGYQVIMSTRSFARGNESIQKNFDKDVRNHISLLQLDINDSKSIIDAAKYIENNYDNIDILVNNAGIHYDYGIWKNTGLDKTEKIKNTISTNFYGAMEFTQSLLPRMNNSRIICLSNRDSALKKLSPALRTAFLDDNLDQSRLNYLMQSYQTDAINGEHYEENKDIVTTKRGWINSYYLMSYVGVNVFCKILGKRMYDNPDNNNWIASYCPGHCSTDSTDHFGERKPSESAFGIVTLAKMMLDENTPNGKFWAAFYRNDDLDDVVLNIMDLTNPTETISWDALCENITLDPKIQAFE